MARPLASDALRSVSTRATAGRIAGDVEYQPGHPAAYHPAASGVVAALGPEEVAELAHLRAENGQLHQLCADLEQALQEASQHPAGAELEARAREYEDLLEEKSRTIGELNQQLQEARSLAEGLQSQLDQVGARRSAAAEQGPVPCEEELLALSEELERERRQLQEDEQALMEQMREMEVSMARERAEMARQRNDLQRLHAEIRHDIERHERTGALQSKIESLKSKLQDATARRGAAPAQPAPQQGGAQAPPAQQPALPLPGKGTSFMGRLFGK